MPLKSNKLNKNIKFGFASEKKAANMLFSTKNKRLMKKGNAASGALFTKLILESVAQNKEKLIVKPKTKAELDLAKKTFMRMYSKNKWISPSEVSLLVSNKHQSLEEIHRIAMKLPIKIRQSWINAFYTLLFEIRNFENFSQSAGIAYSEASRSRVSKQKRVTGK